MSHQCVHCKRIIPAGSKEILQGCEDCGSHFFFYIRDDQLEKIKEKPINIPKAEKKQVEKDIREMAGIIQEDIPVILDIEAVRVTGSGKFEIDLVNLFNRERPIVYKLDEGKYVIDLASSLEKGKKDFKKLKEV